MAERVERRLKAILAAAVAGYSRLMGADEEGTLSPLSPPPLQAGQMPRIRLPAGFSASPSRYQSRLLDGDRFLDRLKVYKAAHGWAVGTIILHGWRGYDWRCTIVKSRGPDWNFQATRTVRKWQFYRSLWYQLSPTASR